MTNVVAHPIINSGVSHFRCIAASAWLVVQVTEMTDIAPPKLSREMLRCEGPFLDDGIANGLGGVCAGLNTVIVALVKAISDGFCRGVHLLERAGDLRTNVVLCVTDGNVSEHDGHWRSAVWLEGRSKG
jgi:hypothetical protein